MTKLNNNKNYNKLSNEYVSGFVHADGTFTNSIIKGKKKLYLNPRFILTQNISNIYILELIKVKLNNVGYIKKQANGVCKYSITNIKDIHDYVLPFFDKYQVRGNRYLSYLKFKLLVKILYNEKVEYRSTLWLFLLTLSTNINPLVLVSKQLRYLNNDEQNIIKNKLIFNKLDYIKYINKYCLELNNINILDPLVSIKNSQPLTRNFVCGLFDGDGSLNIRLIEKINLGVGFQIIQDSFNKDILNEILIFFNNVGIIKPHKREKSISYLNFSTKDIYNIIIPKLLGIDNHHNLKNLNYDDLDGPKIKLYKFYNFIKIYELVKNNSIRNNKVIYNEILLLLYKNSLNPKNMTFDEWKSNKNFLDS